MGSRTDSADMVDYVFSIGAQLKTPAALNTQAGITGIGITVDPWAGGISGEITNFNKNNVDLVWYYYDMLNAWTMLCENDEYKKSAEKYNNAIAHFPANLCQKKSAALFS